jgi:YD repeat-containing protein
MSVPSFVLYDGLGQQVQTQSIAEGTGTVVTDTGYDAAGRVMMANNSYWTPAVDPSVKLFVPASEAQIPSKIVTTFDGAGRPTASVLNSYLVEQYRTSYAYPGADRTDTNPPAGGTPTSVFTDSLGQQTKLIQYLDTKVSAAATKETTTYGYNVQGKMTSMVDPVGNKWGWGFDVLGRQVSATDPDTGTNTKTYDNLGNLLTSTDSRGTTLAYSYDALNRKTGQYTPSADSSGSLLASWTYDTLAKGQLTSSSSFTGSTPGKPGLEYKDSITGYTDLYQPSGETINIPTGAPAFGGTNYSTSMFYFADGALSIKNDPAAGGLPAERLRYGYNSLGKQGGVYGLNNYASTVFTAIGQVAQVARYGPTGTPTYIRRMGTTTPTVHC